MFQFIDIHIFYYYRFNSHEHSERWAEISKSINWTGTYQLKYNELCFGCKLAWRNAPRCIGRIQWNILQVLQHCGAYDTFVLVLWYIFFRELVPRPIMHILNPWYNRTFYRDMYLTNVERRPLLFRVSQICSKAYLQKLILRWIDLMNNISLNYCFRVHLFTIHKYTSKYTKIMIIVTCVD